jgi:putative transcriptional regulator
MEQFLIRGPRENKSTFETKMLVATTFQDGTYFERSLIYLIAHDHGGAMGAVINKPYREITDTEISEHLNIKKKGMLTKKFTIYNGGPLEEKKFYILSASREQKRFFAQKQDLTLFVNPDTYMKDRLRGKVHDTFMILKGFTSWGPGQLEQEIEENSWIVIESEFKMIYSGDPAKKWEKAIKKTGIKNINSFKDLVSYSGNA